MRKKVLSAVLAATMVAGMMGNVVSVSAEEKYDLTLYSVNTTDPDFDDWLANVEEATGLNINVIAAPTDTDTRQQKITTILSTGDSSVDIVEINWNNPVFSACKRKFAFPSVPAPIPSASISEIPAGNRQNRKILLLPESLKNVVRGNGCCPVLPVLHFGFQQDGCSIQGILPSVPL